MGVSPLVEAVVIDPPSRRKPLFNLRHEHRVIAWRGVGDEQGGGARSSLGEEPHGEDQRGGLTTTPTTARSDHLVFAPYARDDLALELVEDEWSLRAISHLMFLSLAIRFLFF